MLTLRTFPFIFFCCIAFSLSAQQAVWVETFPSQNTFNPAFSFSHLAVLGDGTFWTPQMKIRRASYSQFHLGEVMLYRMDFSGAVLDSVPVYGNANVEEIIAHGNEAFVRLGYLDSIRVAGQSDQIGLNFNQAFLHIDANGQEKLLWFQDDTTTCMTTNQQGELLLLRNAGIGGNSILTRMDTAGNILSTKALPGIGFTNQISQRADGRYLISGSCMNQNFQLDSVSASHNFTYTQYVLALDATFQAEWINYVEDITCNEVHHAEAPNGKVLMGSISFIDPAIGSLNYAGPGPLKPDFLLTQLDLLGQFEWVTEMPGDTHRTRLYTGKTAAVGYDRDGNGYMIGHIQGFPLQWDSVYSTVTPNNSLDVLIGSWDSTGALRWVRNYGGSGNEYGDALYVLGKDSLLIAGTLADTTQFDSLTAPGGFNTGFVALIGGAPPASVRITQTLKRCQGEVVQVGSSMYTLPGTYVDTLQASSGADSIVTTVLSFGQPATVTQVLDICFGESVTIGSNTYTVAGIYQDTLQSSFSCDSVVNTRLTVSLPVTFFQAVDLCQGQSLTVGNQVYTVSGTYIDTLQQAVNGCDSVVTTLLNVRPDPRVSISAPDDTLCNTDGPIQLILSPPGGQVNGNAVFGTTFDPSQSGLGNHVLRYFYTDSLGCPGEDSLTISVQVCAGLSDPGSGSEATLFSVGPNPTDGILQLIPHNNAVGQQSVAYPSPALKIHDLQGRLVWEKVGQLKHGSLKLDVQELESGTYFLSIHHHQQVLQRNRILILSK